MTPAAAEVVRIIRSDPGAYAEAFRICAGTLWHRGEVTGLRKADDMLIVNQGRPVLALAPGQRVGAAAACGLALRGMMVSRAAREHGIGLRPPVTVTGHLIAAALDAVDWDEVGGKLLAAAVVQLTHAGQVAA